MSAVTRHKALPPWAKHLRWLVVVLTTSPWVVFQVFRFLPPWAMGSIVLLYAVIALQVLLPQWVEVGSDGLVLRSLGRRRFVRFDRIRAVMPTSLGVELQLDDGRELEIRLTQTANGATTKVERLVSAIEEGRTAFAKLARSEEEALLARGGRDLDTWLREMRAIGDESGGGYRALAVPPERLWEIVRNPSADPSAREGAAVALRAALDEDGKRVLAEVIETTASPRLRVALEAVAKVEDESELRGAIARLDEEDLAAEAAEAAEARARTKPR
jgi:hypothetical protein